MNAAMMQQMLQAAQANQQANNKPLVEFRAGKLNRAGNTVTADSRKGKVVVKMGDDNLLHFKFELRPGGEVEEDLTLMPEQAVWEKVPECTNGRVFILRDSNAKRIRFFWMQEPKDDKDEEIFTKMNEVLKNPPRRGGEMGSMGGMGGLAGMQGLGGLGGQAGTQGAGGMEDEDAELQRALQMSLMMSQPASSSSAASQATPAPSGTSSASTANASGAASPTPETPAATAGAAETPAAPAPAAAAPRSAQSPPEATSNNALSLQLAAIAQQMVANQANQQRPVGLTDVLDPERVAPLVQTDQDIVQSLLPHLPEGQRTPHHLQQTLRSAQLRQTLARLSSLLNSEQYGALMASLGLQPGDSMGVPGLLNAVADQAKKDKEGQDKK